VVSVGNAESALLIDADVLAYRAAFATEKTKYIATQGTVINNGPATFIEYFDDAKCANAWSKDKPGAVVWSRKELEPAEKAVEIAAIMVSDIWARFDGMPFKLFLSGSSNFRYQIATRKPYKSNRQEKPKNLQAVRDFFISEGAQVSEGQEADDDIAIAMTNNPRLICVSVDKDLLQLPGQHYNFVTKASTVQTVQAAWLSFWTQCITGDATDNVPGIEGMGPVKAKKALTGAKSNKECWGRVIQAYEEAYEKDYGADKAHAFALECARLVYLRRKPYELFTPPL